MLVIPIIAGYGKRGEVLESFVAVCPFCGRKTTLKIYQTSNNIRLYFVPMGRFNKHYYLVCHLCDKAYELSQWERDELLEGVEEGNPGKRLPKELRDLHEKRAKYILQQLLEFSETGQIRILSGKAKGQTTNVVGGKAVLVGKDSQLATMVLDNSYTNVSRVHCSISFDSKAQKYYVVDQSTNGTYLENGVRLTKNARTPVARGSVLKLADDCKIKLI